ncbi:MAG: hypothetical protein JJE52_13560 [Acidimicrobiia bacterium]|nr:hypothetical protein [Acidimicrobiia bacterium]
MAPTSASLGYTDIVVTEPALIDPSHLGDMKINPLVVEYRAWTSEHAKACKLALDAGVDAKLVQLAQSEAQNVAKSVMAAINDLDLTPEQAAKAPQVIANILRAITGEG